jgi:hypothetical protein
MNFSSINMQGRRQKDVGQLLVATAQHGFSKHHVRLISKTLGPKYDKLCKANAKQRSNSGGAAKARSRCVVDAERAFSSSIRDAR